MGIKIRMVKMGKTRFLTTLFALFVCLEVFSAPSYNTAYGSHFTITAADAGLVSFTAMPKAYFNYMKNGKAVKKTINVVTRNFPVDKIECSMKSGPPAGKYELYIVPKTTEGMANPVLVTGDFNVMAPTILAVTPGGGAAGMKIVVTGTFFGVSKPKITMNYAGVATGSTYRRNCTINTPLAYMDENGNQGSSCMNIYTGDSSVTFLVPPGLAADTWEFSMTTKTGSALSQVQIRPPQITALNPASGAAGDKISVPGTYFGQAKPKIWMEYTDPKSGKTKKTDCIVEIPLEFPDAKGRGGKSCMNVGTGESLIKFVVPSGIPGPLCVFHLNNKTGEATANFTPTFSISGSVSRDVMQGVTLTLYSGGVQIGAMTSLSNGAYTFVGLSSGTYTIVPSLAQYTFSPPSYELTIADANLAGENFIATKLGAYLVIDVSGGPGAVAYPYQLYDSTTAPADIYYNDEYKTNKIVFRKITTNGSVVFSMGSPATELGRNKNETQHQVTLTQDFYISVFEMTQKQYWNVTGSNPSYTQSDMKPVEQVSWDMARGGDWPGNPLGQGLPSGNSFAGLLSAKTGFQSDLPTEAQWEFACRAGTGTALNTGQNLTAISSCPQADVAAWYSNNSMEEMEREPGQKIPNYWGLFDMHGNLREWVLDRYVTSSATAVTDPVGPETGSTHVVRGGSWNINAASCRSARRTYIEPQEFFNYCGFRTIVKLYGLSGVVSGDKADGVTLTLSGAAAATATTVVGGAYTFYGLLNGTYTVTPSLSGYTFAPASLDVVINNFSVANVNFVSTQLKLTISGSISGDILPGVTLTLSGSQSGTALSKADGTYFFTGITNGNFTVTPSLAGYTFTPASKDLTVNNTDVVGINFAATKQ